MQLGEACQQRRNALPAITKRRSQAQGADQSFVALFERFRKRFKLFQQVRTFPCETFAIGGQAQASGVAVGQGDTQLRLQFAQAH
ncbi:hypothetical protein CFBP1573P_03627 [Pseudomonas syringae pv. persicae]|uniref:Uncharacterized protein n=1 Tax=Pseudomonas syringae pv. persicae TaxID=237306 RepID=A0AB38EJ42_9PSED|nr:hypothetical protein CFBP1573P_03627 [Pseudomonas syringae pv. persicae]SOQ11642.1 hypothetical protein NCPPB2254_03448 [Pseudomonas syringae pv. persicae]